MIVCSSADIRSVSRSSGQTRPVSSNTLFTGDIVDNNKEVSRTNGANIVSVSSNGAGDTGHGVHLVTGDIRDTTKVFSSGEAHILTGHTTNGFGIHLDIGDDHNQKYATTRYTY